MHMAEDIYLAPVILAWIVYVILLLAPIYLEKAALKRKRIDWFSPLPYELMFLPFLGLFRPLFIAFNGWETAWGWTWSDTARAAPLLVETMALQCLGQAALLVGYYTATGKGLARGIPEMSGSWDLRRMLVICGFALVAALYAWSVVMAEAGGLSAYLNRAFFRRWMLEGKYYTMVPTTVLFPLIVYMLWADRLKKLGRISIWATGLLLFVAVILGTFGSKGFAMQAFMIAAGLYHYLHRRFRLWHFLAIGVLLVNVMVTLEAIRTTTLQGEVDFSGTEKDDERSFLDRTFNATESIDRTMVVIDGVPDIIPYQYFTTYSRIFTTMIPRAWWPEKPGLGEAGVYMPLFGQNTDGKWGSYPAGNVGDYYLQLGPIGVIVGFFLGGLARRTLYEYLMRFPKNPGIVLLYFIALMVGFFNLRNQFILNFILNATPLIIFIKLVQTRSPEPDLSMLRAGDDD